MTDCKVEMINNGMQEFFLQFHKPKHSKFLTSFSGISLNMIYTTFWVIVPLVAERVMTSHNSPSMYQNFKTVRDCAIRIVVEMFH